MRQLQRVSGRLLATTVAVAACVCACGTDASQTPTATQNPAARALASDAAHMAAASSFTFSGTVTVGAQVVTVTGAYNSGSLRETVVAGRNTITVVEAQSTTYRQTNGGSWTKATSNATPSANEPDPRLPFNVLADATSVTATGGETQFTLSYATASRLIDGAATVHGTATIKDGLLTAITYSSTAPSVVVKFTYAAVGAAPAITAPAVAAP